PRGILDLGCGAGWTSHFLAKAGYTVTGVDISPDAIAIAESNIPESLRARLTFRVGDYEANSEPGAFDYVLFYDALHHAEDEEAALRTAYAALKPGGAVITLEPGRGHSQTNTSRNAVKQYGVHEKDMPPQYLLKLGRRIGFLRSVVLPLPHDLTRFVYRRDYFAKKLSPVKLCLEKLWGAFRVIGGLSSQAKGSLTIQWR
ncbi:MAG TPA: class I SAM-dependent methyltransferase, partial [Opitutus sp.]|nr:class I SAM-dependent methyltransferase [Opitutus sp.]